MSFGQFDALGAGHQRYHGGGDGQRSQQEALVHTLRSASADTTHGRRP